VTKFTQGYLTERSLKEAFGLTDEEVMNLMQRAHKRRVEQNVYRQSVTHNVLDQQHGKDWTLYQGDCIPVMSGMPSNSVHLTVHSPPFSSLYIYSDSEADMGNSRDDAEFMEHYKYAIEEMWRITVPGRLNVVHCKDLPAFKNRDGAMGLVDFPGEIIRAFESINTYDEDGNLHGRQFHSRVTIWKDPVVEMERTKNNGLLYRNFRTNAEACRQGMADYLIVFRKWDGSVSPEPVVQEAFRDIGDYVGEKPPEAWEYRAGKRMSQQYNHNLAVWQRYASPVWFDINQMDVLNYEQAKAPGDSKHICPLQLEVIRRCIDLWSNPGDVIFDPFAGIASTPYSALQMKRKAIGIELKDTYFKFGVKYCQAAEAKAAQPTLFDLLEEKVSNA
jgi:DNA modification methylase